MSEQGSERARECEWVTEAIACLTLPTIMKTLNWTYLFNWKDVPAVIREFFFYSVHSFIHLFAHVVFLLVPSISSTCSWWVHTSTVATSATLLVLSVAQSTFSQETHTHSHSKLWKSHSLSSCLFICYVAACCYYSWKGMGGSDSMSDVSAPIMSAQNQHIYFRRVEENFCFGYC